MASKRMRMEGSLSKKTPIVFGAVGTRMEARRLTWEAIDFVAIG
ncbi:AGAP013000-PA [Anopheles gambiae str. PEST]|uniref:AGAP013000-PA n=1 Tax=Anopheles gambiae TaxID=7165 RepID=F5HJJ7_ANOGA|nr:AGAP013000-PA [Anopheles gambiae str. PEST]